MRISRDEAGAGRLRRWAMAGALILVPMLSVAEACPLCRTESGGRVRAGIFGGDFGWNLAATLTPAVVLVTLVALIHFGLPGRDDQNPGETS